MEHVAAPPTATATDGSGTVNRLWVLSEPAQVERFTTAIGVGPVYIADGHHRFETALAYREEMRRAHPDALPEAGFNHALALINSARDDGLRIFPTHRLIAGLDEEAKSALRRCMEQHFEVEPAALSGRGDGQVLAWIEAADRSRPAFAAYQEGARLLFLVGKEPSASAGDSVVGRLDVSILHQRLIDPILAGTGCATGAGARISHDSHASGPTGSGLRLTYTTEAAEAIAAVDRGDYDVAFFLRPTRVFDVMAAARAGERMPGKSTYFYPKIPAGLVVSDASEEPV
jgi:uncharacterized protein (DUF1015 family)